MAVRLLRLGPMTIPTSSTGCHPALAMAFLCSKGLGTKPLLSFYMLPCAANQPILRWKKLSMSGSTEY
jgi:hypothetical protein